MIYINISETGHGQRNPRGIQLVVCVGLIAALTILPYGCALRGVTLKGSDNAAGYAIAEKTQFIRALKERGSPLVFSNAVPAAESLEIVESDSSMVHLMPAIFGGFVGTHSFNFEVDAAEKIGKLRPLKPGNILIVDNIKTDLTAGPFSEYWNNYLGALLLTYEGYGFVYEIAEISPDDLYNYLHGIKKGSVTAATENAEVKKFAVFRGVVHSVTGKSMQIASPKTSFANSGQIIVILNRSGKAVGKARVGLTYHTKVTATLVSGDAQKGYSAEIYP